MWRNNICTQSQIIMFHFNPDNNISWDFWLIFKNSMAGYVFTSKPKISQLCYFAYSILFKSSIFRLFSETHLYFITEGVYSMLIISGWNSINANLIWEFHFVSKIWSNIDLEIFGYALRMRWLWLRQTDDERSWLALPDSNEPLVEAMFRISTHMDLGDGQRALFWSEKWLDGRDIEDMAPCLHKTVGTRLRKRRTIAETGSASTLWLSSSRGCSGRNVTGGLLIIAPEAPMSSELSWGWDRPMVPRRTFPARRRRACFRSRHEHYVAIFLPLRLFGLGFVPPKPSIWGRRRKHLFSS